MKARRLLRELPLHIMIWPGLVVLLVYQYIPMVGISIAFQDFKPTNGLFGSTWIGLQNFEFIFGLPAFNRALWNTVFIASMKIVAHMIVPLCVALMINEVNNRLIKRGIQTSIYLLHFVSWVILAGILLDILSPSSGILNQLLGLLGIEPIFFLGDPKWFPYVLVVSDTWKEFGFSTIVYLAALTGINPSLYEAAHVDGASRLRQIWNITLPGMRPIIVLLLTLSLGSVLNAGFDQVFNLYSPSVYTTGDIIDTMVYRMGLQQAQYSIATAIGLFKSVIALVLISLSYWLAYRIADYRIF